MNSDSTTPIAPHENTENIPITPTMDSITDQRIDAITQRFSWFANPDHQWSPFSDIVYPSMNVHHPTAYHLRRRPQIRCPACLQGELGQLAHMQGPHGCLYSEQVVDNE
jgi:hypothetical protein